jgi:hypothetical protein
VLQLLEVVQEVEDVADNRLEKAAEARNDLHMHSSLSSLSAGSVSIVFSITRS